MVVQMVFVLNRFFVGGCYLVMNDSFAPGLFGEKMGKEIGYRGFTFISKKSMFGVLHLCNVVLLVNTNLHVGMVGR
jgi:hypothetical protein